MHSSSSFRSSCIILLDVLYVICLLLFIVQSSSLIHIKDELRGKIGPVFFEKFIIFVLACFLKMQLSRHLTQDFVKEGFLAKTGPKPSDGFKRRWFTLDGRKLMYHEQKLVGLLIATTFIYYTVRYCTFIMPTCIVHCL